MRVRVAFMGDVVAPQAPGKLVLEVEPETYDFAVCNLEGTYRSGRPLSKLINLYNEAQPLGYMCRLLGIRYVNLANNHIMDFGYGGLKDLLAVLSNIQVTPTTAN